MANITKILFDKLSESRHDRPTEGMPMLNATEAPTSFSPADFMVPPAPPEVPPQGSQSRVALPHQDRGPDCSLLTVYECEGKKDIPTAKWPQVHLQRMRLTKISFT